MKKSVLKLFSIFVLIFSLFTIPASANEYSGWRSNTIYYSGAPQIVYANSSQWDKRYDNTLKKYYWICATPDFQQGYCNAWICTDGKWYYVGTDGEMRFGTLVGDKNKKERYLLGDDGAMQVNTYWEQFGYSNYIDNNGLVHLPDVYYKM